MVIKDLISDIKNFLITTHAEVDAWFGKPEDVRVYRPQNGGWTIDNILEHIVLTSHFLLIIIRKGKDKALRNVHQLDLKTALDNYVFQKDRLDEIGLHKHFLWIRPEHMEPKGAPSEAIREQLKAQLNDCLATLDALQNGEGVLYKTTMSVNDLGKIDVYEYVYFLAQHQKRHVTQMVKNEKEYCQN